MAEDREWGLVESFGIDDGELDGLLPHECFTLGVEWRLFYEQLLRGQAFEQTVHVRNRLRLRALCSRHARRCDVTPVDDQWVTLVVGPKHDCR